MKYEKGFKFMDAIRDYEVIEYMEQYKMYRLNNLTDNKQNVLITESDIDMYISKQEQITAQRERNRRYLEQQEQAEREERERELKAKQEYEFCYGYCNDKTDLQKGKILKVLNTKEVYDRVLMTRKDIIHKIIKNSKNIELKTVNNTNRYSARKMDLTYKKLADKIEYRIYHDDGYFLVVTKTEYDYAKYLIDNNKIVLEAEAV